MTTRRLLSVLLLLLTVPAVFAADATAPAPGETRYVQVATASVKGKPVGFAPSITTLKRGDKVEITGPEASGYLPIRFGEGKTGFILRETLVTKERYKEIQEASVDAKSVGEDTAAYGAAKGWDKATEGEYSKKKNMDAQFRMVDRIEAGPFPGKPVSEIEKTVLQFATEGKLGEAALVP
jgi:hypothetical protein